MAKTKKNNQWVNNFTFISFKLNKEQLSDFDAWRDKNAKGMEKMIDECLKDCIKQSTTWDEANACFIVSWTGTEDNVLNAKKCLTSRSPAWWEAMLFNAYKHLVIFNGENWESEDDENRRG